MDILVINLKPSIYEIIPSTQFPKIPNKLKMLQILKT